METHSECISRWNVRKGKNGLHEKEGIWISGVKRLFERNGASWTGKTFISVHLMKSIRWNVNNISFWINTDVNIKKIKKVNTPKKKKEKKKSMEDCQPEAHMESLLVIVFLFSHNAG